MNKGIRKREICLITIENPISGNKIFQRKQLLFHFPILGVNAGDVGKQVLCSMCILYNSACCSQGRYAGSRKETKKKEPIHGQFITLKFLDLVSSPFILLEC